jgi:hypothetical protein
MSVYMPSINEKTRTAKLLDQLDKVPLGRMYQASFRAVVRLHLFFTGRTHELMLAFLKDAKALISDQAGRDQVLDGTSGYIVQIELTKLWGDTFKTWSDEFEKVRVEAASIPFGILAVAHERLIIPEQEALEEMQDRELEIRESVEDGVFSPQLNILLNAAGEHLYGDSLNLSQRIWRIDREARDGINALIMNGISSQTSAWDLAQQLEQYLGANQDCPRWTSTRLYGKTKTQIATGDTTGLLSGNACDGRGVSYNALRLARTEIQKAHALATDRVLASQPWVEKEKVNLSAAHPEQDICDETVQGGEKGEGVYTVGTIELPLHPNCLCYKTAVLMEEAEFTSKLRAWMTGSSPWTEMDDYEQMIGGDASKSILPNAINLAVWLFGDNLEKWIQ